MAVKNTLSPGLMKVADPYRRKVMGAMRIVFEVMRTEVVKRTPKDLGNLRNTIRVDGPYDKGRKIRISIVAGGPVGNLNVNYAIIQHEDLTFKHTEGRAKYIESVIFESRPTIMASLRAQVKL